ncbi:MAG: hypothetical protein ABID63_17910 [Pseudomonadota bacterium]
MYVFIFTTVVIGFACAGLVMIGSRLLRRKAPKYMVPIAAGLGMFVYMIWDDYTWFDRYAGRMPPEILIVESYETQTAFAPWTLLVAQTDRFTAIDTRKTVPNPGNPRQKRITTLLAKKGSETLALNHLMDCSRRARAYITTDMPLDDNGFPAEITEWFELPSDDSLLAYACP